MLNKYSLKIQLVAMYILIFTIAVVSIGYMVINHFEDYYRTSFKANMEQDIELIADSVSKYPFTSSAISQSYVKHLSRIVSARITFISIDGDVIADSSVDDIYNMDNHMDRVEIKQALQEKTGFEARFSQTLKTSMYYSAFRIDDEKGFPKGIIRLARPLTEINLLVAKERQQIGYSVFGISLIIIIISIIMITRFTNPIQEISTAIDVMANGNYGMNILEQGNSSELTQLINAFNKMSSEIDAKITTILTRETQLSTIIRNMVSGLLLINPAGDIILSNPAANQLFPVDNHHRKHYVSVIRHTDIMRLIEKCLRDKVSHSDEVIIKSVGKDKRYYKVAVTPLMMSDTTSFLGILVLLHDITEIRKIEQSRRDLIANVSHELRTPITSILGFSETLLDSNVDCDKDQHEFIGIIHAEALRLKKLIEDLLQLAKLEAGQLTITARRVDSAALIKSFLSRMKPICVEKEIKLCSVTKKPPAIYADAFRMEQVLTNIFINAIKFTPPKGSITISTETTATHLLFKIQDTGVGIPPDQLSRIFERFYRIDHGRSHADNSGYGLGLTIVKHLTEAQNGYLNIESEVNKGTLVSIAAPLYRENINR